MARAGSAALGAVDQGDTGVSVFLFNGQPGSGPGPHRHLRSGGCRRGGVSTTRPSVPVPFSSTASSTGGASSTGSLGGTPLSLAGGPSHSGGMALSLAGTPSGTSTGPSSGVEA